MFRAYKCWILLSLSFQDQEQGKLKIRFQDVSRPRLKSSELQTYSIRSNYSRNVTVTDIRAFETTMANIYTQTVGEQSIYLGVTASYVPV